jgi:hypothetical protein
MYMEKPVSRKDFWDSAGKAGLVLGLVSIAFMLVNWLLTKAAETTGRTFLFTLLGLPVWVAKFVGCIALMKFFMKKFSASHPAVDNSGTFRFGMAVAALSALVFSAFQLAYTTWIAPDTFAEAQEAAIAAYGSMLPAESIEMMENMNFGVVTFFTNLIYCFLFGTVLSAIFSRNIPSRNPFENQDRFNTPDEQ